MDSENNIPLMQPTTGTSSQNVNTGSQPSASGPKNKKTIFILVGAIVMAAIVAVGLMWGGKYLWGDSVDKDDPNHNLNTDENGNDVTGRTLTTNDLFFEYEGNTYGLFVAVGDLPLDFNAGEWVVESAKSSWIVLEEGEEKYNDKFALGARLLLHERRPKATGSYNYMTFTVVMPEDKTVTLREASVVGVSAEWYEDQAGETVASEMTFCGGLKLRQSTVGDAIKLLGEADEKREFLVDAFSSETFVSNLRYKIGEDYELELSFSSKSKLKSIGWWAVE